jgi:hypothetical protein
MESSKEAAPNAVLPDLYIPLNNEKIVINKIEFVKESLAARWTGTEWVFNVVLSNGEQFWIKQSEEGAGQWIEIPEPERLPAPAGGSV